MGVVTDAWAERADGVYRIVVSDAGVTLSTPRNSVLMAQPDVDALATTCPYPFRVGGDIFAPAVYTLCAMANGEPPP